MKKLFKLIFLIYFSNTLIVYSSGYNKNSNTKDSDKDSSFNIEFIGKSSNLKSESSILKSDIDTSYTAEKKYKGSDKGPVSSEDIGEPTSLNVDSLVYRSLRKANKNDNDKIAAAQNYMLLFEESEVEKFGKNVLRVRKDGFGDYLSIQAAIDSINDASKDNSYVIIIYPDTYDEKIILKDYVSIIGLDRRKCKIISNQSWNEKYARSGAVVTVKKGQIRNLYIENLRNQYPSAALYMGDQESIISSCDLVSHSENTLITSGGRIENSYIFSDSSKGENSNTVSISGDTIFRNVTIESPNLSGLLWMGEKNIKPNFYKCTFRVKKDGSVVRINDSNNIKLTPYFWHCEFFQWDYQPAIMIKDEEYGFNTTIYHTGCIFSKKGETECNFSDIKRGIDKFEELNVSGKTYLSDTVFNESKTKNIIMRFNSDNGKLEFTSNNGDNYETNIYQGNSKELKTDNDFNCASLKINGKEIISHDGTFNGSQVNLINLNATNITTGTLSNIVLPQPLNNLSILPILNKENIFSENQIIEKMHWKDWAAASLINKFSLSKGFFRSGWKLSYDYSYLKCKSKNQSFIFPVNYENGTEISGIRIKLSSKKDENLVLIRLLKRNEINTHERFETIFEKSDISVGDIKSEVIEFPKILLEENCSYSFEIKTLKVKSEIKIYSVGIRTEKRIY